jgi:hypothetical protein
MEGGILKIDRRMLFDFNWVGFNEIDRSRLLEREV